MTNRERREREAAVEAANRARWPSLYADGEIDRLRAAHAKAENEARRNGRKDARRKSVRPTTRRELANFELLLAFIVVAAIAIFIGFV